ncbi:MAG: cation:proton antiporter, partial [Archaeoglobaceae archaeon]
GIRSIRNLTFLPIAILIFEILTAFLIAILVGNLFELKAMEIFILAAMGSFSSSAVVFKLLTDLKFDDEVKRVILTVSVLDDIWAIIVLAILPQLAVGHVHFIEIASLLVFSIVVTAALVFLGLTLLNRVFNKLIKPDELGVSLAISSALLFATISKSFGLSPALGAFAAGIALSMHPRNVDLGNYLKPVREVFLILFFVSLGLEAGLLSEIPVILFFIPILILFGRFLAFTASNWVFSKRSLDECVRIGFLATAAGEFGLIVSYEALNLGLIEREFLTLSAITMILGALSSSKFTPKTDYAEKIASLVPMEIKVFVDSISMSVSRLVESSGGEFMRLLVIRIARNVLVVVVVSLIGSAMLYILDFFTPELRYVNLAIVLAIIFAVILAVSMRTKSYVEDVCSLLVEKRGVNPKIKRVLSGLTFTFIMLTSLNLIILVSGRFFVEVAKEILMIPLGSGFVTFVFFLTFSLSVYFIYTRIRKIPF